MGVKEAPANYRVTLEPVRVEDDVPPGYKRTDVGMIPEDWEVSTIGDSAETSSGTTPPRKFAERYFSGGEISWVKTLDLNNSIVLATEERVTDAALRETSLRLFPSSFVAVAMYGGYKQIGRTGLIAIPAAVNQALTAIIPDCKILSSYYLQSVLNHRVEYWRSVASSSRKDPNITGEDVRKFPLALPVIAEQQAIAEALSDADALIESLQQLIVKQRALKQGTMQALLTGRQRLRGFTGEWETKSLEDLFSFSGGVSASRDQLGAEGHCYLHYGDIHTSNRTVVDTQADFADIPKLDLPLNSISRDALLDDGDVVFVDASEDEEGASKYVVVLNPDGRPFISGLHTIVAKPRNDDLVHGYRRYCFQAAAVKTQFRFFAVGTKVLGVSKGNIGKIVLSVPTRDEQTAIAAVLSDMDAGIDALEARLAKTRALKAGMMQQLLTGRIRLPLKSTV